LLVQATLNNEDSLFLFYLELAIVIIYIIYNKLNVAYISKIKHSNKQYKIINNMKKIIQKLQIITINLLKKEINMI
jgi:hypothetical protein